MLRNEDNGKECSERTASMRASPARYPRPARSLHPSNYNRACSHHAKPSRLRIDHKKTRPGGEVFRSSL